MKKAIPRALLSMLLAVSGIFLLTTSCQKDETQSGAEPSAASDPALAFFESMGFDPAQIVCDRDRYIVEGDILFDKEYILSFSDSPQARQSYTSIIDQSLVGDIKVYITDEIPPRWATAARTAIAAWSDISGCAVNMYEVPTATEADIIFRVNPDLAGTNRLAQAYYPAPDGPPSPTTKITPGSPVELNSDVLVMDEDEYSLGRAINTMVHEFGHSLGLAHTDWQAEGDTQAGLLIPGTSTDDLLSIMAIGRTELEWSDFSEGDKTGICYMYPAVVPEFIINHWTIDYGNGSANLQGWYEYGKSILIHASINNHSYNAVFDIDTENISVLSHQIPAPSIYVRYYDIISLNKDLIASYYNKYDRLDHIFKSPSNGSPAMELNWDNFSASPRQIFTDLDNNLYIGGDIYMNNNSYRPALTKITPDNTISTIMNLTNQMDSWASAYNGNGTIFYYRNGYGKYCMYNSETGETIFFDKISEEAQKPHDICMETGKLYKVSKDGFHIIEIDPYRSSDRIIGEFPQEYRDTNGGMYIFSSMGSLIVSDGGDKFYSWSTGYKSQDGNNWYNIGLVLVELTLPQN